MSANKVKTPYIKFSDIDGNPLEDGYIYIGAINQNPEVVPVNVYWDSAMTIPAAQPIRTIGGFPSRSGTAATIFTASDYSITVKNKNGTLIHTIPESNGLINSVNVDSIAELTGLEAYGTVNVRGYYTANDGGGGLFNYDASQSAVNNGGTIINGWVRQGVKEINVKHFGVLGDGTGPDMARMLLANIEAATVGKLLFPQDTYVFNKTIPIYPGVEVECSDSTISFIGDATMGGFLMASRSSIRNIKQGYTQITNEIVGNFAFIQVGLFYGVGITTRANYAGYVPGIVDANSVVGNWDAPTDVIVENIHSDISGIIPAANTSFGYNLVFLTNFVKRIKISNISAIGNAVYVDYATSYVTTHGGILNPVNYYNVVRFEWGNFKTIKENASGESIEVSNIYGEGLVLHNHSGVVSMGNAHSFDVSNVSGYRTGSVFHCGSGGAVAEMSADIVNFDETMRKISKIKARDVYTWDEGTHYVGAIILNGIYDEVTTISRVNIISLSDFNIVGLLDATAPTKYPTNGIVVGDQTWTGMNIKNVIIKNGRVSNFNRGIFLNNAYFSKISNCIISNNGNVGIFCTTQTAGKITSNIVEECSIYNNNLNGHSDYAVNSGIGLTTFNARDLLIQNCSFGNLGAAGTETQLHSIFLRNGDTNHVKIKDCNFYNYASASSYDVWSNASTILYTINDCKSSISTDGMPKVNRFQQGYNIATFASGKFNYAGAVLNVTDLIGCSIARLSTGRFTVTFNTLRFNTNYTFIASGSGGSATNFIPTVNTIGTDLVDVFIKDMAGTLVDPTADIRFEVTYTLNDISRINP